MTNKIYARQIAPEYQASPLDFDNDCLEGIVITGNRHYQEHIRSDAFDLIKDCLDDMLNDYDTDPSDSISELLQWYGFTREHGKEWTDAELEQWQTLFKYPMAAADDEKTVLTVLQLLTGHVWSTTTLKGCSQGDWQGVYYDAEKWTLDAIHSLEIEYFNLGTEWIIHNGDTEPETPEDIDGYSMYCYSMLNDKIRQEIAANCGVSPEDVVMLAFDGYCQYATYREV